MLRKEDFEHDLDGVEGVWRKCYSVKVSKKKDVQCTSIRMFVYANEVMNCSTYLEKP